MGSRNRFEHARVELALLVGGIVLLGASRAASRNPWNLEILQDEASNMLAAVGASALVVLIGRAVLAARRALTRAGRSEDAAVIPSPQDASVPSKSSRQWRYQLLLVGLLSAPLYWFTSGTAFGPDVIEDPNSELSVIIDEGICSEPTEVIVSLRADRGIASRRVVLERVIACSISSPISVDFVDDDELIMTRQCEAVTVTFDPTTLDVRHRTVEPGNCDNVPGRHSSSWVTHRSGRARKRP